VEPGKLVARGQRVGTVGTANGHHAAHLHFEIRRGGGIDMGAGYGRFPLNRLDPAKALAERSVAAPDDLAPSPLATALK
jgi:murein DD-endopeptidase MepM/ murein hydrolase activator NlpD